MLKSLLKTISSDVRSSVVGAFSLAILGGIGGILYISKTALAFSIEILTTPVQTWGILVLVLTVIIVYFRLKNQKKSCYTPNTYKVNKTIMLTVNDYKEIELNSGHTLKIELKEIKKEIINYPYLVVDGKNETKEKDVAVLNFDRMFPLSSGICVKQLEENEINEGMTFSMPKYTSFTEEDVSVFSFSITNTSDEMNFFRCLVKHINPAKQEVELDVYYVRNLS